MDTFRGTRQGFSIIIRRIASSLRQQDWTTVTVEVLVVVIGLLLGLQLNEWAQGRQDQRLVDTYYRQMIVDLENDVGTGEFAVDYAAELDAAVVVVSRIVGGDDVGDVPDSLLLRSIIRAGYSFRPLSNRHTYDELINTGGLSLIRDTAKKRAIANYYGRIEQARQWDRLVQHEQITYRDAVRGLLNTDQMRWVRDNLRKVSTDPPPVDRPRLLAAVRERETLPGALTAMAGVQARFRGQAIDMSEHARALVKVLEAGPARAPE